MKNDPTEDLEYFSKFLGVLFVLILVTIKLIICVSEIGTLESGKRQDSRFYFTKNGGGMEEQKKDCTYCFGK